MARVSAFLAAVLVLLAGAAVAFWDLQREQARTVVVYTTPALRDVLELGIAPRFAEETGYQVSWVYVAAGQQYNRLRMSEGHQEAHVFLHASPFYLEKGADEGFFTPFRAPGADALPPGFQGPAEAGGRGWMAFAWSPLVEVYDPSLPEAPDLRDGAYSFGMPHPVLSNNGVYAALFFDEVAPDAGQRALRSTVVQPVNARTNIGGLADGSFQVTLGYEAVVRFYRDQGAVVKYELPLVGGERVTTPVLFSAGLVAGDPHPGARELLRFLFENETQALLGQYHFRPVVNGTAAAAGLLDPSGARAVAFDWAAWDDIERILPKYVVSA